MKTREKRILKVILVAVVAVVAAFPYATFAGDASLNLYPLRTSASVGSIVSTGVFISSASTPLNAVSAVLSFPADVLEVTSIDTSNSIFSLWVEQPTYSNETGTIRFGGIALNPGFKGTNGRIMTIRFKVKAADAATVRFTSSMVLANDGHGTELPADASAISVFTPTAEGSYSNRVSSVSSTDYAFGPGNMLTQSGEGTATGAAQVIIVLLIAAAVVVNIYNGFRLRRIEMNGVKQRGSGISLHDEEVLRKVKKDLAEAEEAISHKLDKS